MSYGSFEVNEDQGVSERGVSEVAASNASPPPQTLVVRDSRSPVAGIDYLEENSVNILLYIPLCNILLAFQLTA